MQLNCGRILEACIVVLEGRAAYNLEPSTTVASSTTPLTSEVSKHTIACFSLGFSDNQMTSPVSSRKVGDDTDMRTWGSQAREKETNKLRNYS